MRVPKHLALLIAGLTVAFAIRFGTFAPWGPDPAGYIEAGRRWRTSELMTPAPLHFWPPLADHGVAVSPAAFRPGALRGTEVSLYPLGYPVLLGAATAIGGELAAYLVSPLFAGVLVWCVYSIAARAAGDYPALIAALLIAASPVTLLYALMPMSDVTATALWALAWMLGLRHGIGAAIAAGSVVAVALTVRPILAPLGLVAFLSIALGGIPSHDRARARQRTAAFVLVAAAGPVLVAWSQSLLYGSPLTPGYMWWESFFRLAHVSTNLSLFPRQLVTIQSWWILLGLAAPLLLVTRSGRHSTPADTWLIVASAMMVIASNYAVYLPYTPYDDLFFIRFMLPALMGLCILHAVVVAHIARLVRHWLRWLVPMALIPALFILVHIMRFVPYALDVHKEHARVRLMGEYLRQMLPSNAVVFTGVQGGAVAHYTRAQIVRFDLLESGTLDLWVDRLARRGFRPVLVVDEALEMGTVRAHASAATEDPKYRWIPRAEFHSTSAILYFTAVIRGSPDDTNGAPVDVIQ